MNEILNIGNLEISGILKDVLHNIVILGNRPCNYENQIDNSEVSNKTDKHILVCCNAYHCILIISSSYIYWVLCKGKAVYI